MKPKPTFFTHGLVLHFQNGDLLNEYNCISCPLTHNWELGNKCFDCRNTMASSSLLGKSQIVIDSHMAFQKHNRTTPTKTHQWVIEETGSQTIILKDKRPLFTNITPWTTSTVTTRWDRGVVKLTEEYLIFLITYNDSTVLKYCFVNWNRSQAKF